ncbi:chitinase 2-like [Tasmannia lanceolata]|uniref:chitinase 2-like n=1 Tax=Tasmannia lanceolata TaxID=3420 RepID=UPI0040647D2A
MEPSNFILGALFALVLSSCNAANSNLFREYIGAESSSVKLSDVPINPDVEFHFIVSFAIDYSHGNSTLPTNGKFNIFWETKNLGPSAIESIKDRDKNVKVAVSLGGDTVGDGKNASFDPKSISSWVNNAVHSLTKIIRKYNLDGIDIDYEHFIAGPDTFAECIGQLITTLKEDRVISFASIAPFNDDQVQSHYLALWRKYGHVIDYVNFQFYAYDKGISVTQFVHFFHEQAANYGGGEILASFISDGSGGLGPNDGFFEACRELKRERKLGGIFVWCADESQKLGFQYEKKSQELLASSY